MAHDDGIVEQNLALGAAIGMGFGLVVLDDLAIGMAVGGVIGALVGRARAPGEERAKHRDGAA